MRKKISKKESSPKTVKAHSRLETMKLDDLTRLSLLRHSAEMGNAQAQANMKAAALTAYIAQIDPKGRIAQLQAEIELSKSHYVAHQEKYIALCREISRKLGINMQEYAFDDETGVLTPIQKLDEIGPLPTT